MRQLQRPPQKRTGKRLETIVHTKAIVFSLGMLMLLVLIASCFLFARSYNGLRQAIQQERMQYVEEISSQIITSQQFMEKEFSDAVVNYAGILNRANISSLADVRACLASKSAADILLVSPSGEITDLNGSPAYFSDRQLMRTLPEGAQVVQLFTSLNYAADYWLFATHIDPLTLDGVIYNTIILTVPADEFRESLAISLFDGRGASYIINNDGSIKVKPTDTNLAFEGYNLLSGMAKMGASEADIALLESDMRENPAGSFLFQIDREDWLISHCTLDAETSIVVAVPLAVTAAMTYSGLSGTILFAIATVLTIAAIAILFILYFFYRDRQRSREAMAVAAKSDFFSKMSHDIRTPLSAVIGLELLAKDSTDDPKVKAYLSQSSAAADYLLGIINDVLDMSRIESGKLTIANIPFDMNRLMEDVKNIVAPMAAEKGLRFDVSIDAPFETNYLGDQVRVKQILINLLSNSTKFTPSGGGIALKVTHTPDKDEYDIVTMTVSDTGIGMSRDYLSRIFSPFEQERSSYTEQYTGSGLGLSIVHSLTAMMGGTINVESQEDIGSTFTVALPLARSNAQIAPESDEGMEHSEMRAAFAGKRVLLAEDNMINQQVAVAILSKKFDLLTDVAANGLETLNLFSASPEGFYDLILMDVKMPVMDGLEATRRIRTLPRADAKRIPIIALSANAFEEDVALSLDAGMNDHLAKPINVTALGRALNAIISQEERP